jgi:hypothetical protein
VFRLADRRELNHLRGILRDRGIQPGDDTAQTASATRCATHSPHAAPRPGQGHLQPTAHAQIRLICVPHRRCHHAERATQIGGYFARVREDQVALRNELPSASVLGTAFTAADRSHGTAQDPACRMPRPRHSTLSAAEGSNHGTWSGRRFQTTSPSAQRSITTNLAMPSFARLNERHCSFKLDR